MTGWRLKVCACHDIITAASISSSITAPGVPGLVARMVGRLKKIGDAGDAFLEKVSPLRSMLSEKSVAHFVGQVRPFDLTKFQPQTRFLWLARIK